MIAAVIAVHLLASVQGACAEGATASCTFTGCLQGTKTCDFGRWSPCECLQYSDTTPPNATLTAPASGAVVGGYVGITANASDNKGVTSVSFEVDGIVVNSDTEAPYAFSWASATVANGTHSIVARAHDAAGNTKAASVTVTVSNNSPPTLSCATPPSPAAGDISLSATAYDEDGFVRRVEFSVGGASAGDGSSSDGHNFGTTLNSRVLVNGPDYTAACRATDSSGLTTSASTAAFEVWNQGDVPAPFSVAALFDATDRLVVFKSTTRYVETNPGSRTFDALPMSTGGTAVSAVKDQSGHLVAFVTRTDGDIDRWDEPFGTSPTIRYTGPTTYDGSAHGMTSRVSALQRRDGLWVILGRGPEGHFYIAEELWPGFFMPWRDIGGDTYDPVDAQREAQRMGGPLLAMAGDGSLLIAYTYLASSGQRLDVNREQGERGAWTGFRNLDYVGLPNLYYPRVPPIALLVDSTGRVEIYYGKHYRRQALPGGDFGELLTVSDALPQCTAVSVEAHGDKRTFYCSRLDYYSSTRPCSGPVYYSKSECPGCAFSAPKTLGRNYGPWVYMKALGDPLTDRDVLVHPFTFNNSMFECPVTGSDRLHFGLR